MIFFSANDVDDDECHSLFAEKDELAAQHEPFEIVHEKVLI